MNITCKTACLSLLSVMAACAPAGYYDSNGQYRSYGKSDSFRNNHAIAGTPTTDNYAPNSVYDHNNRSVRYDQDGYEIEENTVFYIPRESLPPTGMCRLWFPGRSTSDQPPVGSCDTLQNHVPAGAYMIYGK